MIQHITSHSAQGATANRVLIHVDSASRNRDLINSRLAYVAVSRARDDARIYTGDGIGLGGVLSHSVTKRSALGRDENRIPPILEKEQNAWEQRPADNSARTRPLERTKSRDFDAEL